MTFGRRSKGTITVVSDKVTIEPTKLADILGEVEDLLLDIADDPALVTEGEREAIAAFEAVATTAVEDGTPVIVGWQLADILHSQCVLDSADLVGGAWPVGPDVARWVSANPEDCTQDFDGICRCDFDPLDH